MKSFKYCFIFLIFFIAACNNADIKHKQYMSEGYYLYTTHCANCHQADGVGLAGLYPPLANADFLEGNKLKMICYIRNGVTDTLVVNGKKYMQPMPANTNLQPIDLAEITTYVYNKWGGESIITPVNDVNEALKNCK
jgi:cytochrome c551